MKELNWKHIVLTAAFIVLFWPLPAGVYFLTAPWFDFIVPNLFFATCIFLGVVTSALVISGVAPSSKKKVLHGFLATVISLPIAWFSTMSFLSYLVSSSD